MTQVQQAVEVHAAAVARPARVLQQPEVVAQLRGAGRGVLPGLGEAPGALRGQRSRGEACAVVPVRVVSFL